MLTPFPRLSSAELQSWLEWGSSPARLHNCCTGCWAGPFPPSVLIYVQESPGPHGPPSLNSTHSTRNKGLENSKHSAARANRGQTTPHSHS